MADTDPRTSTRATAALAVLWRVPQAIVEEFEEFYDREHIPERMGVPGFLTGVRRVDLHQPTRQLALFDLADPTVLEGNAYRALGAEPSAWARRIVRLCEVTERLVCSTVLETGVRSALADWSATYWMALLPGTADAAAVDVLAAAAVVLRCRLLHAPSLGQTLVIADLIGPEVVAHPGFVDAQITLAAAGATHLGIFR